MGGAAEPFDAEARFHTPPHANAMRSPLFPFLTFKNIFVYILVKEETMPQLSLYLNDEEMEQVRENAARQETTLSRYVAGVLRGERERNGWPSAFFALYGSLADDDSFREPDDEPFDGKHIPALN